jgi:hypothetical protein
MAEKNRSPFNSGLFTVNRVVLKKVLCRNHLFLIITVSEAMPLQLRHPPVAMVPNYLFTIIQEFPVFLETDLAPPCLGEALRRGALPISNIYKIFIA